jgi:hypothetical protein
MESGDNSAENDLRQNSKRLLLALGQLTHGPDSQAVGVEEGDAWLTGVSPEVLPPDTEVGRKAEVQYACADGSMLGLEVKTFNEEITPLLQADLPNGAYPLGVCYMTLEAPKGYVYLAEPNKYRPQSATVSWGIFNNLTMRGHLDVTPVSPDIASTFTDLLNDELDFRVVTEAPEVNTEGTEEWFEPDADQMQRFRAFVEKYLGEDRL